MDSTTEQRAERMRRLGPPRYGGGPITTALNLGPLASLPGSWKGTGFSVMWRPDNATAEGNPPAVVKRFLQLNLTSETLDFHVIPGAVPNRGLDPQIDLNLYGLHYLQRVGDDDPPPSSALQRRPSRCFSDDRRRGISGVWGWPAPVLLPVLLDRLGGSLGRLVGILAGTAQRSALA